MKLLRWTLAGASFYVVYKYTIGKKSPGEPVFDGPPSDAAPAEAPAEASRETPADQTAPGKPSGE